MTLSHDEFAELQSLVELLCEQRIDEPQLVRLQQLVQSDADALRFYVDYLDLHAQFMWRFRWYAADLGCDPASAPASESQPTVAPLDSASDAAPSDRLTALAAAQMQEELSRPRGSPASSPSTPLPPVVGANDASALPDPVAHSAGKGKIAPGLSWLGLPGGGLSRGVLLSGAVIGLLLVGAGLYAQRMSTQLRAELTRLEQLERDSGTITPGASPYAATLVSVTNCRWDKSRSTADLNSGGLRPGQSLHLVEGVAKISSTMPGGGVAQFQLEGPLAMRLTSEGMPSLLYGRLTGSFACEFDRFTLDTPLGRVIIPGDASIGVMAAANEVEVHVFSGAAMFECWSNGLDAVPDVSNAQSGTSLCARIGEGGGIFVEQGKARENSFVTPGSLAASRLLISDDYVAAIHRAKPLGYWRFESDEGGLVRNEVADRLHCRVVGDAIRLHTAPDNRSAEFGATSGPGYFFSDDVIADVGDTYSAEAWVKPAYYHHALLFALVLPTEPLPSQHRFLVELCGPGPGQKTERPWENHPNRLRYLQRGTGQCFSADPYGIRKWQHVVTVKDRADMRLYVDGRLVASANDPRPVGNNLHVLMGQLYPQDPDAKDELASRLFVGELDEVAFYDRALSAQEVQEHYRLAQPDSLRASADSF